MKNCLSSRRSAKYIQKFSKIKTILAWSGKSLVTKFCANEDDGNTRSIVPQLRNPLRENRSRRIKIRLMFISR